VQMKAESESFIMAYHKLWICIFGYVFGRFFDEPGSQIVTKARSTASANQEPPNGTTPGLTARTDNNSGTSALQSLAARQANAPRGYGGFLTM